MENSTASSRATKVEEQPFSFHSVGQQLTVEGVITFNPGHTDPIQSVIIFVLDYKPQTDIIAFAKGISLLGYACIIPNIKPIDDQGIVNSGVKILDILVANIRNISIPLGVVKNIGILSYSQGSEICGIWSQNSKHVDKVKGVFTITPSNGEELPAFTLPVFMIIGELDSNGPITWDRSDVKKYGVILKGGLHSEYFIPPKLLDRGRDLESKYHQHSLQYRVAYDSIWSFFTEVFSKHGEYTLDALNALVSKYPNKLRRLYYNPKQYVIEGTDFEDSTIPSIIYRQWIGKLLIGRREVPATVYRYRNLGEQSQVRSRVLFTGLNNALAILNFHAFNKLIYKYFRLHRQLSIDTNLNKEDSNQLKEIVNKIIFLLQPILSGVDRPDRFPIEIADIPLYVLIREILSRHIGSPASVEERLRKVLHSTDAKPIYLLTEMVIILQRLKMDPWYHAAYAREIIWKSKSEKCASYVVEINDNDLASIQNKFSHLSLRMGQSLIKENITNGNCINQAQEVYIYFHTIQTTTGPHSLSVDTATVDSREQNLIPDSIESLILESSDYHNDFHCFLSHYLVPIPKDEKITSIELQFQNPSGAIMLSEVAFTN